MKSIKIISTRIYISYIAKYKLTGTRGCLAKIESLLLGTTGKLLFEMLIVGGVRLLGSRSCSRCRYRRLILVSIVADR